MCMCVMLRAVPTVGGGRQGGGYELITLSPTQSFVCSCIALLTAAHTTVRTTLCHNTDNMLQVKIQFASSLALPKQEEPTAIKFTKKL